MRSSTTCPSGWTSTRLSDAFVIDLGKMLNPSAVTGGNLKPYLANRNVQWNRFELDDIGYMDFSESERNHFILKRGDLLICEGGEIGRTAIWNSELPECYFQKALHRLRPREGSAIDPRFILHYMRYATNRNLFQGLINQTSIAHFTREKLSSHRVYHPESLVEQRRIAEILDSVDEQIQLSMNSIAKQNELRIAAIRQLAVDGLGCYQGLAASELRRASERSSGSWSLVPLGSLLTGIDAGNSPDLEDTPAGPGQWGVLKVSAVGENGFRHEENKVAHYEGLHDPSICAHSGDLLMTRANTSQLVGRSCIVGDIPNGLMLSDKILRLRVAAQSASIRYVHIILGLAEVRRQIEIAATGTSNSMKNISQSSVRQLIVPIGGQEDINRIVEIDKLHEKRTTALRDEAEALRLLKHGLMDDLLTGRVRAAALSLSAQFPVGAMPSSTGKPHASSR